MSRPRGIHAFTHWRTVPKPGNTYARGCAYCDWLAPYQEANGHGGARALGRKSLDLAAIRKHVLETHPERMEKR